MFRCHPGVPAEIDPVFMTVKIIIGIAAVVLIIFITQHIYKDASKRGLNAELWLLIAFIVPIISWIVYFMVRDKTLPATTNRIIRNEL